MKRNEFFQTNKFASMMRQDFSGESHSITEHLTIFYKLESPNLITIEIQQSQLDFREPGVQINGNNMQMIAT
jgi:hypothetical protein